MQIKQAVLDRFVDQTFAVLLVGPEEIEQTISVERLPAEADEGSWLTIDENGTIFINTEETERIEAKVNDKLAALKNRSETSRYKK